MGNKDNQKISFQHHFSPFITLLSKYRYKRKEIQGRKYYVPWIIRTVPFTHSPSCVSFISHDFTGSRQPGRQEDTHARVFLSPLAMKGLGKYLERVWRGKYLESLIPLVSKHISEIRMSAWHHKNWKDIYPTQFLNLF